MSSIFNFFSYNKSVLSGAMDIIMVKYPDGTYKSSPFRIRFGTFKILRAKDKKVEIFINGKKSEVTMRLSESGEAYFQHETIKINAIDPMLDGYSSPVELGNSAPTSPRLDPRNSLKEISENFNKSSNGILEKGIKNLNVEKFIEKNNINNKEDSFLSNSINEESTQISNTSNLNLEKCNEEYEEYSNLKDLKRNSDPNINSFVAKEDILNEKEKIFRKMTCEPYLTIEPKIKICREEDFQVDSYLPSFSHLRKMELSNCWNAISKAKEKHEQIFTENKINKEEFFNNPWKIIGSANLAIKFGNNIYTWKVIAPIIMSTLCFGENLPENILSNLTLEEEGYFFWRTVNQDANKIDIEKKNEKGNGSKEILMKNSTINLNNNESSSIINNEENININFTKTRQIIELKAPEVEEKKVIKPEVENINKKQAIQYRKSNAPTSDQIKSLNLNEGKNEITFVVTNRYQGEVKKSTEIYLWNYNDKIIISDLDGTITKSDVLGQVLPMFGRDWSHTGVVKLYNDIFKNGYKILYLTARALCQSDQTKNYLNQLEQSK